MSLLFSLLWCILRQGPSRTAVDRIRNNIQHDAKWEWRAPFVNLAICPLRFDDLDLDLVTLHRPRYTWLTLLSVYLTDFGLYYDGYEALALCVLQSLRIDGTGSGFILTPPDHHQIQNPTFSWYSYSMKATAYIIKLRCVGLALMSRTLFSYPPCLLSKLTSRWRTTDLQRQPKTAKCIGKCKYHSDARNPHVFM